MDTNTNKQDASSQGNYPVPRWIPERESAYGSFVSALKALFAPRKVFRVKIKEGVELMRAPQLSSGSEKRSGGFRDGLKEIFTKRDAPGDLPQAGTWAFGTPALGVDFGSWKESLRNTFNLIFRPDQLPALSKEALAVKIDEDGWATKEDKERSRRRLAISLLVHAVVLVVVAMPIFQQLVNAQEEEPAVMVTLTSFAGLPPAMKRSQGGGGGGDRSRTKASRGKPPAFDLQRQLAPPTTKIKNLDPELAVDAKIVAPEMNFDFTTIGDPLANMMNPSDGTGAQGGIGSGLGGGIGIGGGIGFGPGSGGGVGGGYYQVGGNVSGPACIDCPEPEFTEEARKAKYSGIVVIWAIIDVDGRAKNIEVVRGAGLGLDEEAVRAVMTWYFRPGERNGKPVRTATTIEVNFTIY